MLKRDTINPTTGKQMTPKEIQNKWALPETPTHIQPVVPKKDTLVKVGQAAGKKDGNNFGDGGGIQFKMQDKLENEWFKKGKRLKE